LDSNAPATVNAPVPPGVYPGAGSSFLEMQFYFQQVLFDTADSIAL
jgi:hypothetical protein